jgi:hypothetical protein
MNAILPCSGWSNWENKKSLEKIREWLEISSCAFSPIWGLLFDAKSAHFHLPIWIRLSLSNSIECRYWETVFCVLLVKRKRKKTGERIHRSPLGHSASVRRVPVKCIYNGETFGFGMLRANRHNAPHFSLLGRHPILPRLSGDIVACCICIIPPPAIGQNSSLRITCADSDRVPRRISGEMKRLWDAMIGSIIAA